MTLNTRKNVEIIGRSQAVGESWQYASGQSSFLKSMKGKILNFLHEVEKMISVISVQVQSEKLDFPS